MSLRCLPCLDDNRIASRNKQSLDIDRKEAARLGRTAVEAFEKGWYRGPGGKKIDWKTQVQRARTRKITLPPEMDLYLNDPKTYPETLIQVSNETTLSAAHRLNEEELTPVALNFANGVTPGGGFLSGARAQEEVLCRSSALHATLAKDRMYNYHRNRSAKDSSDWAIYSPGVPVFRTDSGQALEQAWLLSFITCAAPQAKQISPQKAAELMKQRIHRVLMIAQVYQHPAIVLGAWGCGAFGNDPKQTALDFREALETEFKGAFSQVVFAITDWSKGRKFLGPFRDVFS